MGSPGRREKLQLTGTTASLGGGGGGPNSSEGAFNLFPNTYSLAPRSPILTPLYSAPSRGEKVWVQPSLRALIHTNLGKGKENYRSPQFLPSQP